jgi:hypothetical protein
MLRPDLPVGKGLVALRQGSEPTTNAPARKFNLKLFITISKK